MARVVVDEIVTQYDMDPKGYLNGVNKVNQANKSLTQNQPKGKGKGGILSFDVSDFDPIATGAKLATGALAATTAGFVALGMGAKKAFEEFAQFDSMVKALESVEGSAQKAKDAMHDLYELAKAPGIGFEQSVQAYVQLRNTGLGKNFSKDLIKEIANANARGGGTVETFSQAMLAASQVSMKPFLQGQELLQFMNAGIPVMPIMQRKFGTADTEELKKAGVTANQVLHGLVEELKKLPRVEGGAQNSIDNFMQSMQLMAVSIGGALDAAGASKTLEMLSNTIEKLTQDGVFATTMESIANSVGVFNVNGKEMESHILDFAAMLMTVGDHFEIFKGNLEGFLDFMKEAIRLANHLPTINLQNRLYGWIFGTNPAEWASGNGPKDGALGPGFEGNRKTLERQMELAAHKAAKNAKNPTGSAKDADAKPSASHPDTVLLQRIADNTNPLREIADQILGGGAITRYSLNKSDVSDLKGRGGGHTGWKGKVVDAIGDAVIEAIERLGPYRQARQS